jgi:hypothetical protein
MGAWNRGRGAGVRPRPCRRFAGAGAAKSFDSTVNCSFVQVTEPQGPERRAIGTRRDQGQRTVFVFSDQVG